MSNSCVYSCGIGIGLVDYSTEEIDIINTVTGERLKENPFVELHDILDGRMKN